jgi:hypothetical protein
LLTDPGTNGPVDSGLFFANADVTLQSTLMAGNRAAGQPADISKYALSGSVEGASNLIFAADCAVPADTIEGIDPLLGDLDPHGGPTFTIDLLPGSPAIDTGNDAGGGSNDQRGVGFPRVVGPNADIGAFETSPPQLSFSPVAVDFGTVAAGSSADVTVTFTNAGSQEMMITSFGAPTPPFALGSGTCGVAPATLPPRFSCDLVYRFTPSGPGSAMQTLDITSTGGAAELPLSGFGSGGDIIFADGFDP